jgi:septum formation protein
MLDDLGICFSVKKMNTEESYPDSLNSNHVAEYLAVKKAAVFNETIADNELIITADTVVIVDDLILGKPEDKPEAVKMLQSLSGRAHKVVTGVCLLTNEKKHAFSANTDVYFKELTEQEINYYIDKFKPYDKAGAYGIQEWIGFIGVERIDGSYYNVVGLPIQKLHAELMNF